MCLVLKMMVLRRNCLYAQVFLLEFKDILDQGTSFVWAVNACRNFGEM